jgi:hypothetical protein
MASSAGTMPNTGRWGWYQDHEGNEFRRVTKLIEKVKTDTFTLDEWKKRQVLLGAARRNDIILGVKALGEVPPLGWSQQTKKQLSEWAKECMTAAGSDEGRINGTAVHDLTERVDRGESIEEVARGLPTIAASDLRAYAKLRELNGWRSVDIERTVVCDELEVAGSFDRIDVVPGLVELLGPTRCQHGHSDHIDRRADDPHGELPVIVDVKTEGNPLLNGLHIGPQLAIYSRAKRMWLPAMTQGSTVVDWGQYVPAPCVRQDVAVIVHVRDGKAIPYFVDLTAGWEAAQAAVRQLKREQSAKRWFAPVPGIVEPKPAEVLTEIAVAAQWASPDRPRNAADASVKSSGLATAMLDASKVTATALGPAPMPTTIGYDDKGELPIDVPMPDHKVGDTVNVGGIKFTKHSEGPATLVAVNRNGAVTWEPEAATQRDLAEQSFASRVHLDDIDKSAYSNVMKAPDLASLAETYRIYTEVAGRTWGGVIAAAADARRKQIECPQRALHTAGTCACGWTSEPPF